MQAPRIDKLEKKLNFPAPTDLLAIIIPWAWWGQTSRAFFSFELLAARRHWGAECVHRKERRWGRVWNESLNEEQLRELSFLNLEKRRLRGTLYNSLKRRIGLFSQEISDRSGRISLKLHQGKFRLDIRKIFLPRRNGQPLEQASQDRGEATNPGSIKKTKVDVTIFDYGSVGMVALIHSGLDDLRGFFQP